MNEIKTIGIIGMGTIGISISVILQQAGLHVIGFKHKDREPDNYKELIKKNKIQIINHTENSTLPKKSFLDIKITSSLDEITNTADLILNCCRFPQNLSLYKFDESQKTLIRKKNTPIFVLPGNLGSSWLLGQGAINIGVIGYSPVFATSKKTPNGITVNILDFKSEIPLAHDQLSMRMNLLKFLNTIFKPNNNNATFIDGKTPIQTALSSPISAINAAAICDNSKKLIDSKGLPITTEIYVLSEKYSELFQRVFQEQIEITNTLQTIHLHSLKDWLLHRTKSINHTSITTMLKETYEGKYVTISREDRRLSESLYTLLFFKYFAEALECTVPSTVLLLDEITNLQSALNTDSITPNMNRYIRQSAISYAKYIRPNSPLNQSSTYHLDTHYA